VTALLLLQNVRRYSIKSAIFNFAAAWKGMKTMTLANGWAKLLQDTEPKYDFKGFETFDFHAIFRGQGTMFVKVTLNMTTVIQVIKF
jgi:hypothetical protein